MTSTLQALVDRADRQHEIVAAGEVIDLRFPEGGKTLSARASKLFHLLVQSAGARCAANQLHRIPIAWLRNTGLGHLTIEEFVECIRELASVTIDVEVRDEAGRAPHVKTGAFLAHIERDLDAERGELLYEFSRTMRYVFERSAYWAVLDRRTTLAFESRYAIRLYELMSLRARLEHKHAETFELPELRARLGVPGNKLTRWVHLRQKALEPAIAEVNRLSPFRVSWEPVKRGRAVEAVRFQWCAKPVVARIAGEIAGEAAGETVGAAGDVVVPLHLSTQDKESNAKNNAGNGDAVPGALVGEAIPAGTFPAGRIAYTRWADLVRTHAPRPTPDVELVAGNFRRFAAERGLPLAGPRCERAFIGYCAKFKVR